MNDDQTNQGFEDLLKRERARYEEALDSLRVVQGDLRRLRRLLGLPSGGSPPHSPAELFQECIDRVHKLLRIEELVRLEYGHNDPRMRHALAALEEDMGDGR